ncbi:TlpA family protein disulfide reductase [Sphingobacterium yanglingense]|uniref:Thiol-disulfide isomerase/thioredoxin n=1 Tax=Sphingobacterium yanglingense TaxID=1437280 RepID=A0A4R6WLK4_9SPHI|nr:TlpA disulfide reductase family protein [Sphingobacterium yanglingense]TDQ81711.1 thiol-disulfide isomerase/thioredoxin [Sphingobacterium yanglingense]
MLGYYKKDIEKTEVNNTKPEIARSIFRRITLFYICGLWLLLSCIKTTKLDIGTVHIVAGTSKLTGKIITPNRQNKNSIMVSITVLHPISGENIKYEIPVNQSGEFAIEVDIETDTTYVGLQTSLEPYKALMVRLVDSSVTNIDIAYDGGNKIKYIEVLPAMNLIDMTQSTEVLRKMIEYTPDTLGWVYPQLFDKNIDEFLKYVAKSAPKRLELFLDSNDMFSKEFKGIIAKDLRLFIYTPDIFDYEDMMKRNYSNSTGDTIGNPEIQKIDRSYFRFLKDFNLNDPQYLQTFMFSEFQLELLRNSILDLPEIGESDIPSWLAGVKAILADLVGFDDGQYYDILTANAYARQLNEQVKPLSEKQKEHITHYWKNGEIAKILFRKNQQVVELEKVKSPVVINDIKSIQKDKVIETIISKYKGKVIFIDLWATWCAPCLDGIKQFGRAKRDLKGKDVVFVYITNTSSPLKLWEEKIKGIGDEHYYLTGEQWEYMMEYFGFEYIPSYLLYNKEGILINKFTSFPGNAAIKDMINDLL